MKNLFNKDFFSKSLFNKGLFNKGLLYKDFRSTRLLGILMFLSIFIFKTFQVFNLVNEKDILKKLLDMGINSKPYYYMLNFYYILEFDGFSFDDKGYNMFGFFIVMSILTVLLSVSLMYFDKKSRGLSISFMVPVHKGSLMLNKLVIGISHIFIAFFVNTFMLICMVLANKEKLSDVMISDIIKWSIRNMLAYVLIFLVLMFVQAISTNLTESILAGLFIINIPYIGILFMKWLHNNLLISTVLKNNIETFFYMLWPVNYIVNDKLYLSKFGGMVDSQLYQIDLEPFWNYKILIMLFYIALISLLTLYFYNNNKLENHQGYFFKENILLELLILVASGFGFIALILKSTNGSIEKFYLNPIMLTAIIFVIVIYILASKYIARNIIKKFKGID